MSKQNPNERREYVDRLKSLIGWSARKDCNNLYLATGLRLWQLKELVAKIEKRDELIKRLRAFIALEMRTFLRQHGRAGRS